MIDEPRQMPPRMRSTIARSQASRRVPDNTARTLNPYTPQTGQVAGGPSHIPPPIIALGDGWSFIGGGRWLWDVSAQTGATLLPALEFAAVTAGRAYKCTGRIDNWKGDGTTSAKMIARIGYDLTPHLFDVSMAANPAGSTWDVTAVAGSDNEVLSFTISDNTTVTSFVMSNVGFKDVTP